jgi:hypothetical protein
MPNQGDGVELAKAVCQKKPDVVFFSSLRQMISRTPAREPFHLREIHLLEAGQYMRVSEKAAGGRS